MKDSINNPAGHEILIKNIYCVGRNYADHAMELKNSVPDKPFFFQKSLPSFTESKKLTLPMGRNIHYELEIVALIGRSGFDLGIENAWDYVSGLGLGLDLTDRDQQSSFKQKRLPWLLSKSFSGSAVVTGLFKPDLKKWSRDFWLKINDYEVQRSSLKYMIFSIPELISNLSEAIPLLAGDLLFTGTPKGVGVLKAGDKCQLGLGENIIAEYDVS
ncbi:MAG: fumarylacetoacetate hydrolase family protein [Candidatus Neomarinimicrobiota bacterium]